MPIAFKCPKCSKLFKVKDELAGKVAGCGCGAKFRIPERKAPPPAAPFDAGMTPPPPAPPPGPMEEAPPPPEPMDEGVDDYDFEEEPAEDFEEEPADDFGADDLGPEPMDDDLGPMDDLSEDADDLGEPVDDGDEEADESDDEEDEDAEDAEEDEEDEEDTPKSTIGRVLIWLGAACVIAGLFLPWASIPDTWLSAARAVAKPVVARVQNDGVGLVMGETAEEAASDGWDAADASGSDSASESDASSGESADSSDSAATDESTAVDTSSAPAATGATITPTGLELAQKLGAKNPMGFAIFGTVGLAVLLALLALIPGKILSGTPQMILGLLLALGTVGSCAASLFALGTSHADAGGIGGVFAYAGLGLFLTLGGSVACFLGGLICSFGVFKVAAAPQTGGRGARGGRSAGRSARGSGRASAAMPRRGAGKDDGEAAKPKPPLAAKKSGGLKPPFAKKSGKKGKKVSKKVSKKVVLRPKKSGGSSRRR